MIFNIVVTLTVTVIVIVFFPGCGAAHTAWQIAISETQRQAIYADPKWNNGDVDMR
jgi:homoserine acetyltransferase